MQDRSRSGGSDDTGFYPVALGGERRDSRDFQERAGGRIFLRVWQKEAYVIVSVADTGVGMAKERYEELCRTLEESRRKGKRTSKTGIGLGNIYKRVYTMYKNGHVKIYSTEQKGCVVQMWIPLERPDGTDEWLWSEGLGGRADGSDTDS